MRAWLAFTSRLLASLAIGLAALVLAIVVLIMDTIALDGCAICDDTLPNYAAAVVITLVGAMLEWVLILVWRAAWAVERYRR